MEQAYRTAFLSALANGPDRAPESADPENVSACTHRLEQLIADAVTDRMKASPKQVTVRGATQIARAGASLPSLDTLAAKAALETGTYTPLKILQTAEDKPVTSTTGEVRCHFIFRACPENTAYSDKLNRQATLLLAASRISPENITSLPDFRVSKCTSVFTALQITPRGVRTSAVFGRTPEERIQALTQLQIDAAKPGSEPISLVTLAEIEALKRYVTGTLSPNMRPNTVNLIFYVTNAKYLHNPVHAQNSIEAEGLKAANAGQAFIVNIYNALRIDPAASYGNSQ